MDQLLLDLAQPMNAAYNQTPTFQNSSKTAHVVHTVVNNMNAFLWLGTEDWQEWVFDDFNPVAVPSPDIGWVHQPSLDNVSEIMPQIEVLLSGLGWPPFLVAGHSKGAREAPIFHALMKEAGHSPLASRLYEPPRAGGSALADYLATENIIGTQTQNAHGADIVTLVPYGFGWENCCRLIELGVPDTFGIRDKHVMSPGVLTGLGLLPAPT